MAEPYITVWTYPWDVLDEGIDRALDTIANDLGCTSISLATSYHTFEQLRPHLAGPKYFVTSEAAVYFRPTAELYARSVLRPRPSPLVTDRSDPLRAIGQGCRERGLGLTSWTVCLHNTDQGRRHPDCCPRNVYGDVFTSHLDPTNPNVRAYVTALCQDLAQTGAVDRIELESIGFGGRPHFHGHEKVGLDLGPGGWFLFTLPFSESCRRVGEQANVDVTGLMEGIRGVLDPCFQSGLPLSDGPASWAARLPGLERYVMALRRSVVDLVSQVQSAANLPVSVIAMGDPWETLCDYQAIAAVVDAIETLAYTPSPDEVERKIRALQNWSGVDARRIVVGLQAYGDAAPTEATLLSCVDRALSLGVYRFSFYNYGIMPATRFPWVRSAAEHIRQVTRRAEA